VESGAGKFHGVQGTINFIAQSGPAVVAAEFGVTPSPFSAAGNAFYSFQGRISVSQ
jgi:hypothetical protein